MCRSASDVPPSPRRSLPRARGPEVHAATVALARRPPARDTHVQPFWGTQVAAACRALQEQPAVNAVIDDGSKEIVYRDYVDIGFAAATPRGLVTPVVRNVESMGIKEIEANFAILAGKAKKDALQLEEMTGSTFTISNGGVFGSMLGTPLIGSTEQAGMGQQFLVLEFL